MSKHMALQLDGWRMTTAEILYHMPDHPGILQSFIWQKLDMPPEFPKLHKFLDFCMRTSKGRCTPYASAMSRSSRPQSCSPSLSPSSSTRANSTRRASPARA